MKKFKITFRQLETPPFEKPEWRDLIGLPWSLVVALFYMLPKAIWMLITGKELEHDEEEFHPHAGWKVFIDQPNIHIEHHYFYAEKAFDDFYWHTVDGYQLRAKPEIGGLSSFYFVRGSFFEFAGGLIAQAIHVEGDRHNCPLVYLDFSQKTIETFHALEKVYMLTFKSKEKNHLLIKGKSSEDAFELVLKTCA